MKYKITKVVAALIWDCKRFMIYQHPAHKARGLLWEFVGSKLKHNGIRWITVGGIDQYVFCPADEEILRRLKDVCKNVLQAGS